MSAFPVFVMGLSFVVLGAAALTAYIIFKIVELP
jgi:hypothetical protein